MITNFSVWTGKVHSVFKVYSVIFIIPQITQPCLKGEDVAGSIGTTIQEEKEMPGFLVYICIDRLPTASIS